MSAPACRVGRFNPLTHWDSGHSPTRTVAPLRGKRVGGQIKGKETAKTENFIGGFLISPPLLSNTVFLFFLFLVRSNSYSKEDSLLISSFLTVML